MDIILDTDCLNLIENPNSEKAKILMRKLEAHKSDEISTTIISFEEQMRGWINSQEDKIGDAKKFEHYKKLSMYVENFKKYKILEFDDDAQKEYKKLKSESKEIEKIAKTKITPMDLRIAAIAISKRAVLICQKADKLKEIPNLIALDWTK